MTAIRDAGVSPHARTGNSFSILAPAGRRPAYIFFFSLDGGTMPFIRIYVTRFP